MKTEVHLIKVPIPFCYTWMVKGTSDPFKLAEDYVKDYIKTNEPDMRFVRIQGMYALCERG